MTELAIVPTADRAHCHRCGASTFEHGLRAVYLIPLKEGPAVQQWFCSECAAICQICGVTPPVMEQMIVAYRGLPIHTCRACYERLDREPQSAQAWTDHCIRIRSSARQLVDSLPSRPWLTIGADPAGDTGAIRLRDEQKIRTEVEAERQSAIERFKAFHNYLEVALVSIPALTWTADRVTSREFTPGALTSGCMAIVRHPALEPGDELSILWSDRDDEDELRAEVASLLETIAEACMRNWPSS